MSESFRSETVAASREEPAIRETSKGTVSIYRRFPAGGYARLKLDSGLGSFAHYSSITQKLEVFERVASQKEGRVSLALLDDRIVIGYLAIRDLLTVPSRTDIQGRHNFPVNH